MRCAGTDDNGKGQASDLRDVFDRQ